MSGLHLICFKNKAKVKLVPIIHSLNTSRPGRYHGIAAWPVGHFEAWHLTLSSRPMTVPYKNFKGQAKGQGSKYPSQRLKAKWSLSCEEGIKSTSSPFPFLYSEQSLHHFFIGTSSFFGFLSPFLLLARELFCHATNKTYSFRSVS